MTTLMNLPDVPRARMFDQNGTMNRVWQEFFRNLFVRTGGNEELSNTELADIINHFNLDASRILATGGDKNFESVADLTAWINGTTDQITATDNGDGTLTLSTPQNIDTNADVVFASLVLNGHSINRLFAIKTITDLTYQVLKTDGTILIDASSNNITITHITAVGRSGEDFAFKRIDSSNNVVTVDGTGTEEIDGDSLFNLFPLEVINTKSDNSNWWITP